MGMDITRVFKARLETVRNRNKALGTLSPETTGPPTSGATQSSKAKSKVFPGRKTEYFAKSRELVRTITALQEYLTDVRSPYLSLGSPTFTSAVTVTGGMKAPSHPGLSITITYYRI
jgi:hypothetical protein